VSNTLAVQDGPRENSNKNCVIKRPEMIVWSTLCQAQGKIGQGAINVARNELWKSSCEDQGTQ